MAMTTSTMSKPVPATIEVAEHEAIVKKLKETHAEEIYILKGIIEGLKAVG